MFRQTGCQGVMAGRGVLKDPWLLKKIAARLAGLEEPRITLAERRGLMRGHFIAVLEGEEPSQALHKMRTFAGRYTKGLVGARRLRERIGKIEDPRAFLDAIDEHFDDLEKQSGPTGGKRR